MYGEIPFITQAYLDRAAISFSTYNGALLMNKEDVTIDVFSQISYENFAGYLDINTCSATSKKSSIYLTKINEIGDFVFAVLSLSATNTVSLNFSIVRNSTSPDTGLGLFWAASIGSLAACYNNDTRYEYGAIIVYNIVKPIITL